jgi:hypothetical protein
MLTPMGSPPRPWPALAREMVSPLVLMQPFWNNMGEEDRHGCDSLGFRREQREVRKQKGSYDVSPLESKEVKKKLV